MTTAPPAPVPPPSRRVTADDVARLAGVSRSAVSRTFTPGASVAADKRERILAVAEHLGYRPNSLAASLKSQSSNLVAIVTGNLGNHYDSVITAELVKRLADIGKWAVVLGDTSGDISNYDILDVLAYPLDAMIIRAGSIDEDTARKCMKLNVPLILSGRSTPMDGVDCVGCDNVGGARLATQELIRRGRTRIGYIGGIKSLTSEQERHDGFLSALSEAGLAPAALEWADFSFEGGHAAALRCLNRTTRPDALFCCNDIMAIGALNAARHALGLQVPEDLAVIGFDDIAMAGWPCFGLTTIRNSITNTVDTIMDLLESRFLHPDRAGETRCIDPILISRDTH
ncbi:LacI family DNA-binding transcriptional regulator [Novispirillum itersonii]|uniref:DNA-binding LacI/PurR family transcriptional regulator n=1 Tax=Novispirillum itersonii TaxID=189 RepID=A0A7X0DQF1_NOVIT|nr:LacI family DNA-binding transcriptional regulator [Novispirillum itersonii]MBB6212207.1 DNA-binding LacI/PurR family transcriptional regulator [Novispirillum itersonii]